MKPHRILNKVRVSFFWKFVFSIIARKCLNLLVINQRDFHFQRDFLTTFETFTIQKKMILFFFRKKYFFDKKSLYSLKSLWILKNADISVII